MRLIIRSKGLNLNSLRKFGHQFQDADYLNIRFVNGTPKKEVNFRTNNNSSLAMLLKVDEPPLKLSLNQESQPGASALGSPVDTVDKDNKKKYERDILKG